MSQANNVTEPIKPTTQTSSFRILVAGVVAFLVLPIILPMVCNALTLTPVFSVEDANHAKALFQSHGGGILTLIIGGGTVGTIGGSMTSRIGKTIAQLFPGIVTPATPDGEGIALKAPPVAMLAGIAPAVAAVPPALDAPDADASNPSSPFIDEDGDGVMDHDNAG